MSFIDFQDLKNRVSMESFNSIFERAAKRKGGSDELETLLPTAKSPDELRKIDISIFVPSSSGNIAAGTMPGLDMIVVSGAIASSGSPAATEATGSPEPIGRLLPAIVSESASRSIACK